MKKILAIATALMLAISSLCVFVVADTTTVEINGTTYEVLFSEDCTFASGGWSTYSISDSTNFMSALQTENALVLITRNAEPVIDSDNSDYEKFIFVDSWWGQSSSLAGDTGYYTEDSVTFHYTFDVDLVVAYDAATIYDFISTGISAAGGGSAQIVSNTSETYTVTNISVVVATEDSDDVVYTYTAAENFVITDYSTYLTDSYSSGDTLTITAVLESDGYFNGTVGANGSDGWGSISDGYESSDGSEVTATYSFVVGSEEYAEVQVWYMSGTYVNLTSLTIDVTPATTSTGSTFTVNGADLGSSNYNGSYDSATQTLSYTASYGCCGWWFGSGSTYNLESFTVTLTENDDSEWWQVVVEYVDGTSSTANGTSTELTVTCEDACIKQIYIQNGSSADQTITVSSVSAVERTSTSTDDPTVTVTRTNDFIYVNEEYHALLVYRNGRRYFVCVPHTVASNGYCTVCHMYIGTDDETSTTTVDGIEYEVAYSEDVNLAASGWGTYEFADNSIIDALATDGALLVITRSEATDVVYDSDAGTYEKLGLVDSWWVGDWLRLGTAGHTDADEADDTIIDCMSDDGTTIIYDGATVYAAWVAAGMDNGGTATLITNTSGTYTITNVAVYVPAGTITAEDVTVDEPAEEGDTDDEEDEDDMNVDDGDEAEAETPAETNPTTGAVLALVPMAIAGLAVVASKRK